MSTASIARTLPGLVMGTMAIGTRCSREEGGQILEICAQLGVTELDTAFMYGSGQTEIHLGELAAPKGFTIATKVNAFRHQQQPVEVGLKPEQVRAQFAHSLRSLKTERVDMLYLHAPDPTVPIEDTLQAVDELHKAGKFKRFGLSNYAAWQVAEIVYLCRMKGYVEPVVYQGMYNGVTRQVEPELFPALRRFNMAFYAYNPLAGGLLTGRYSDMTEMPTEGRFQPQTAWGSVYQKRYWKQELFETLGQLKTACASHTISLADAAHRWMMHHSLLDGSKGDKVILGVSSPAHATANILGCRQGPLPAEIVAIYEAGWQAHKANAPSYFR